ncbi:MAG: efflux RND transporter permease subunit [Acidobacteriota bacterium]
MSHGRSDESIVAETHNTARFFVQQRHIAWVLLIGTLLWGAYAYFAMPKRKDPDIPVRSALALCSWPNTGAEKIEQLVTRRMEEAIAGNRRARKITSNTRVGIAVVQVELSEDALDTAREFDDIKIRLDNIHDLPEGAGPIRFLKDFGDTATLMLTVASPRVSDVDIALRADAVTRQLTQARLGSSIEAGERRVGVVYSVPRSIASAQVMEHFVLFGRFAVEQHALRDVRFFEGSGFVGLDAATRLDDQALARLGAQFIRERLRVSELHPDAWAPTVIGEISQTRARLTASAGDRYSYKELEEFTDLIKRTLQAVPNVSTVTRTGLLEERIYLNYSQERLAAYGVLPSQIPQILRARNITLPGGSIESGNKLLRVDPSGEFTSERDIGDVLVPTASGHALYLRDLFDIWRSYDSPPRFLNFYSARQPDGTWRRSRAVTLAVTMRAGQQIDDFGRAVNDALDDFRGRIPADLILARTSDQPLQVAENVELFMRSLYEAVILVVIVSLIGFWEWRSAVLMSLAIPVTLCMTFGFMHLLQIDIQQVSIASLILALGLLVDDPVVAGDAIKRDLAAGHPAGIAAWLGPTKLSRAILYATITNIIAYLPLLTLSGDTGRFLYSLPVVIACSLVASRLVSMTFIPLLGYYLLRPKPELSIDARRSRGFSAIYYRLGSWAIEHRWLTLTASLVIVAIVGVALSGLRQQFFPKDLSYLSYVDVWLPDDAPLSATRDAVTQAEGVIEQAAEEFAREKYGDGFKDHPPVLQSLTTFLGGGGPRFWFSVSPEQSQLNYAQILVELHDKHDTNHFVGPLQRALWAGVPGANVDVRQLETGPPIGVPVQVRVSGEDIAYLRRTAEQLKDLFRSLPHTERTRDDWGAPTFAVNLQIDSDKANLAGVTHLDIAAASSTGLSGVPVGTLREEDKQIPIVARLRMEERARIEDIRNLYVYAAQGQQKVPLSSVSRVEFSQETTRIQRRNQFRTITVATFPAEGYLASDVMKLAAPGLETIRRSLPPGYRLEIGGEQEEQSKGFAELAVVMLISIASIYLALVMQFRHAVKPLVVFAAIPYGIVGALAALWLMDAPFGFMAFLGVASLVGVIVSHVIVLFDFIEEQHEAGAPLEQALLDAGIMRLRPVLITVGATVIALFPLASHGGPLWEPLCYAQIGGLTVATVVTLLMVPVIYAVFVKDLALIRWQKPESELT